MHHTVIRSKKPWVHSLYFLEPMVRQDFGTVDSWVKILFPYPDGIIAN